ncbi:MAG: formylglycine-generating enzyme family protein [Bacteroidota bacterium]
MKKISFKIIFTFLFCATVNAQQPDYAQELPGTQLMIELVGIPKGSFIMGSPRTEVGREEDEGPQRKVEIEGFWMSSHEVSWDLYNLFLQRNLDDLSYTEKGEEVILSPDAITGATIPYVDMSLGMGTGKNLPVGNVTQLGASKFCEWLSALTGNFYRLPTEAEWEYAARAGEDGPRFFPQEENLEDYAWYASNSDGSYHEIGKKKPNPWGLYDIYGNVAEWTLDQYDVYKNTNGDYVPVVKEYPTVVRGGSYKDNVQYLRSAARQPSKPLWKQRDPQFPKSKWWHTDAPFVGFRIVRPYMVPERKKQSQYWLEKK